MRQQTKYAGIKLNTGTFIDESMFAFSLEAGTKDGWGTGTINHMTSTTETTEWASKEFMTRIR